MKVHKCVSNPVSSCIFHPCLHVASPSSALSGGWSWFPCSLPLYLKPQLQWQLLLLLRGMKTLLICGLNYWSGQEPFIIITPKVSQDNNLAIIINKVWSSLTHFFMFMQTFHHSLNVLYFMCQLTLLAAILKYIVRAEKRKIAFVVTYTPLPVNSYKTTEMK